jgi:hypothetical protein
MAIKYLYQIVMKCEKKKIHICTHSMNYKAIQNKRNWY